MQHPLRPKLSWQNVGSQRGKSVGMERATPLVRRLPRPTGDPRAGIVVEYRERQHDEPVAHFDKPDRLTVSGVHRGEQRRRYDARRDDLIPAHGLRLVVIRHEPLHAVVSQVGTAAEHAPAGQVVAGKR